ncbi:MAG: 23S rRNA (guanosine(2251)-2'-O)-methyltransferase RlmB [Desulfobacca sp.]|uniref:23S rRNA (guanosine(2251)-2'-O)-methyltransferase RlmB n=1 Tax=Desulfobacca sp. TaxID=2067990 RepID=UPI00404A77E7
MLDFPADRIIYGVHAVLEALRHQGSALEEVLVSQGSRGRWLEEVKTLAQKQGVRFRITDAARLQRLAGGGRHQGIVARTSAYQYASFDTVAARLQKAGREALALVLDCLQDPMNLGNLLRSAAAAGAQGVFLPKDRAVGITAAVAKAAAGALVTLPVCRVTNLTTTIQHLKALGLWVVGAEAMAPQPLYAADLTAPLALVIGSEGRGLRPRVRQACDLLLHIPMTAGPMGSLNAATAGGIFLYEIRRQRLLRQQPVAAASPELPSDQTANPQEKCH